MLSNVKKKKKNWRKGSKSGNSGEILDAWYIKSAQNGYNNCFFQKKKKLLSNTTK